MKKLSILLVLAMLMVSAVPALAAEWSFSGWVQTENSYGENVQYNKDEDEFFAGDINDYVLKFRLTAAAKISDQTNFTYQLETKDGYNYGDLKGVQARLAYLTTTPSDKLSLTIGKNAYWLAGGLLADDFVKGISMNYKLSNNLNLFALAGRHQGNGENQIYAAALNGNVNAFNWGVTALSGTDTVQSGAKATANATGKPYEGTLIAAIDAGYNITDTLNISLVYATNTKSESAWETSDDKNVAYKFQVGFSGIEKTGIYLQYFKQDAYMMWPMENGNYMAWWGDKYEYATGLNGFRAIYSYNFTKNLGLELCYGSYKLNNNAITDDRLTKADVVLTYSF